MVNENTRRCVKCVMEDNVASVFFDKEGVCNYCREHERLEPTYRIGEAESKSKLEGLAKEIKSKQKGEYDCLLGLSGGVDSSYVALLAKQMGLKPLAIHFDNGWNSELAVSNIKKIVEKCGFDLYTYVIDWEEFRDLQRSFFKASVVDIELLTDHAISAAMFSIAKKYKIKYVLSGSNFNTEYGMPPEWTWRKTDLVNIKCIQKKFGTRSIKTFPTLGTVKWLINTKLGIGFSYIKPLDLINYKKSETMEILKQEFDWQYYGGKHYESVFTKFYQSYVLPVKFNIDKRQAHLSALIRNGEITRAFALKELEQKTYDEESIKIDKEYVLKKLGFSDEEFEKIMSEEPKLHSYYGSGADFYDFIKKIYQPLKAIKLAYRHKKKIICKYIKNDRLKEYEFIIKNALDHNYQILSLQRYVEGCYDTNRKILILRHDVDHVSVATEMMFNIEKSLGVHSTYYFRKSTFNPELAKKIEGYGSECSYHFETLSDYITINRIRSKSELMSRDFIAECLEILKKDLRTYREEHKLPCITIASHGAEINKRIGVPNNYITEDVETYKFLGIKLEAYNADFISKIGCYISDAAMEVNDGFKYGLAPIVCITNNTPVILFLSHPNHWYRSLVSRILKVIKIIILPSADNAPKVFRRI